MTRDYDPALAEARRNHRCAECSSVRDYRERPRSAFCSDRCRYRWRDRRRQAENPEALRAKCRSYYERNREQILDAKAAKAGRVRTPALTECSECGDALEGRARVVCSRRCRDARYRRLHSDTYAAKKRRKRQRERQAAAV